MPSVPFSSEDSVAGDALTFFIVAESCARGRLRQKNKNVLQKLGGILGGDSDALEAPEFTANQ